MISIVPITAQNFLVFKAVRLRALQDSPFAFGSTYAREAEFTDDEWRRRAENWNGVMGAGFLAMDENEACGIVGSFLERWIERKRAWCRCGRPRPIACWGWAPCWSEQRRTGHEVRVPTR